MVVAQKKEAFESSLYIYIYIEACGMPHCLLLIGENDIKQHS